MVAPSFPLPLCVVRLLLALSPLHDVSHSCNFPQYIGTVWPALSVEMDLQMKVCLNACGEHIKTHSLSDCNHFPSHHSLYYYFSQWRKGMTQRARYGSDTYQIWQPVCFHAMDMLRMHFGGMEWLPLEISKVNCSTNPADLFWTLSNKCQDFSSSKYFWRTVCNVWLQTAVMLARVKYCTWVKIWKQKRQP